VMLVPQAIRSKIELGFVAPFGNPWLTRIMLRSGARMTYFHVYAPSDRKADLKPKDAQMEFGSPSCFIRPLEPVSHWAIRRAFEDSKARVIIDSSHGGRDWKNAYEQFNNDTDAEEWMAQWRENIILFFFAPSWPETAFAQWDGHLEYLGRWLWAPLILVVFVFNIREFAYRRFDLIPVAVTAFTLLLAFQNTVLVEGRYRKPLEPLLILNLVWVLAGKQKATGEPGLQGE
jgi:hypothetical protein